MRFDITISAPHCSMNLYGDLTLVIGAAIFDSTKQSSPGSALVRHLWDSHEKTYSFHLECIHRRKGISCTTRINSTSYNFL